MKIICWYLCSKSQGIGKHRVYNYTFHHRRCKNPQWDPGIKLDGMSQELPSGPVLVTTPEAFPGFLSLTVRNYDFTKYEISN